MPAAGCLTTAELAAFHLGDMAEPELAQVAAHLESCRTCDEAARALDGLSDPTLTAYRQSARAGPLPDSGALPQAVPGYEILAELGRGGMGVVYKARHLRLQRVVALKMLLSSYFANREQRQRFRAEAEAVARLQHPNIVQLFETGEHDVGSGEPRPYFTLEFVEGGSLAERLEGRPLPPRQAAAWLELLARAVSYAHAQGIIHRDLKPSNVLLTGDGQPKVCDFGVAKVLSGSDHQTQSGLIVGTVEYMAPEQAEAGVAPGPAADVYALGVILYEMLTGRPPFKGATTLDTLSQVRTQPPVPLRRLQPSLPRDLETICLKCLAKEPARRYPSAAALAEDLRRLLAHEPIVARPTGSWERVAMWGRRRPAVAALTAAVVVTLIVGASAAGWQWRRAVTERNNAEQLADKLRVQRDAAEWQSYRAEVAAAASALELHNVAAARRHLDAAPERYRNWEWRHFAAQLDAAQTVLGGHTDMIRALAFSPDSRRLVSASADRTVRLWDVGTGASSGVWCYDAPVQEIALRPDGTRLACATAAGTLWIHDLTTGSEAIVRRDLGKPCNFLAFSPDGSRISVGTIDGAVAVKNAAAGEDCFVLRDPRVFYRALALSPDGRWLAVGTPDGSVRLWDTADGRLGDPMRSHTTLPLQAVFSPDGRFLVTTGQNPDHVLRLWRVGENQPVALLPGHTGQLYRPSFNRDGSRIVTISDDKAARLWDGATGQAVAVLEGHGAGIMRALFSPDGRLLATGSEDQTLRVWEVASGKCLKTFAGHTGPVRAVAWSPDGTRLASAGADAVVRLWDLNAVGRTDVLRGHTEAVTDVAFSPDGAHVLSASGDGLLWFWDAKTGRESGKMFQGRATNVSVALSPNGRAIFTIVPRTTDGFFWDLAPGKPMRRFPLPAGSLTFHSCAFHPSGTLVAGGGQDGSVHLWDVPAGRHVAALKGHTGEVTSVAVSRDGRQLASAGGDGLVCLWDLEARQLKAELRGHSGRVYSVAYSADGSLVASGGQDQTVRLWNVRTHAELACLRHDSVVTAVRFHPDGSRLAAACGDGTIRLWDVAAGEEVAELRGHGGIVHAIAFSPDGTQLVSGSADFTARLWETIPLQSRAR